MYKKGDIVKIRGDLQRGFVHNNCVVNYVMVDYKNKLAKILRVYNGSQGYYYALDIDNSTYFWSAEMFESVKPKLFKLL